MSLGCKETVFCYNFFVARFRLGVSKVFAAFFEVCFLHRKVKIVFSLFFSGNVCNCSQDKFNVGFLSGSCIITAINQLSINKFK